MQNYISYPKGQSRDTQRIQDMTPKINRVEEDEKEGGIKEPLDYVWTTVMSKLNLDC